MQVYQLSDHEAGCLLPCLVEKSGHNQVGPDARDCACNHQHLFWQVKFWQSPLGLQAGLRACDCEPA